ncbi:MAG: MBL fold metallo-hydrolase, partial [Deltaproteobacteria bacterium]|nr:MBL fold metallo-hydrolase [Deltaproteobacteria bacterium]
HTKGNSIVIVEAGRFYYMLHGDITYTDEALRRGALSVVFEDKELAQDSLEKVRSFVLEHDTVYLSTHTPEGLEALNGKRLMKL